MIMFCLKIVAAWNPEKATFWRILKIKWYLYIFLNIRHTGETNPSVKRQFSGSVCDQNSQQNHFKAENVKSC